jgi:hypothetical protein
MTETHRFAESPRSPETLKTPVASDRDMRGVSTCWQSHGWHAYSAGPCFDTYEQVIEYRDSLDREGITWRKQP